jgi:hypothetical protein
VSTFLKLAKFLFAHRQELIEVEEAIRAIVIAAKQAKAA